MGFESLSGSKVFDKKEESERIAYWLMSLNKNLSGWTNGDSESNKAKTADLVNHKQKLAVELKREKGGSLDGKDGNLVYLSNRIQEYLKDSNRKFKNYQSYRTLAIIELASSIHAAQVVMSGIHMLHFVNGIHVSTSFKNKKLYSEVENIGAIIFWPAPGSLHYGTAYYFENPIARPDCKLTQQESEEVLGKKMQLMKVL